MTISICNAAAISLGFIMLNASVVHAGEAEITEKVKQEVVQGEKQNSEQEKTEEGEASGNVEDCEQSNESARTQDGVDKKELDDCEALVK